MSDNAPPRSTPGQQRELDLALVSILANSFLQRSQPEYILTAAALGAFGALDWGVAALHPGDFLDRPWCKRPAGVAAIGIALIASTTCVKIWREWKKYGEIKQQQATIFRRLAIDEQTIRENIPPTMLTRAGCGFLYSIALVAVAAAATIAFCVSLLHP